MIAAPQTVGHYQFGRTAARSNQKLGRFFELAFTSADCRAVVALQSSDLATSDKQKKLISLVT